MNQNCQHLIKVAVAAVIIAGLLGALCAITEGIGMVTGKFFTTCLAFIFFGITGTISMVTTSKTENKVLGTAGMVVSSFAFVLISVMMLGEIGSDIFFKIAFALFISSIALAHISLLHYFTLQNKYAVYARIAATTSITLFSVFIIVHVFSPLQILYSLEGNQPAYKVIIASLIVDLAATLLVPLCNRLNTTKPTEIILSEPEPPVTNDLSQGE